MNMDKEGGSGLKLEHLFTSTEENTEADAEELWRFWVGLAFSDVVNKPSQEICIHFHRSAEVPSEEELRQTCARHGPILQIKRMPTRSRAIIRFFSLENAYNAIICGRGGSVYRIDYSDTCVLPKAHFSMLHPAYSLPIKIGFYQNSIFYRKWTTSSTNTYLINCHKERLIRLYVDDHAVIYMFKYSQIETVVYCETTSQLLIAWAIGTGPLICTFDDERTLINPLQLDEKGRHCIVIPIERVQDINNLMTGFVVKRIHLNESTMCTIPPGLAIERKQRHCLDIELILESLISIRIPKELLTEEFYDVLEKADPAKLKFALRFLANTETHQFILDPTQALQRALQQFYKLYRGVQRQYRLIDRTADDSFMRMFALEITPTKMFLTGPTLDRSNRVLRKYNSHSYHFLRVTFRDDDGNKLNAVNEEFQQYISDKLKNGVTIAGRTFKYLAYANSELKNHSCYLVAPFDVNGQTVTAEHIIKDLGVFREDESVAKSASRIGQCLSTTVGGFRVKYFKPAKIDDIRIRKEKSDSFYCFSDGIGKISPSLATKLAFHRNIRAKLQPCAFQIRYKGYKGMVVIDKSLQGDQLHLRQSMRKFKGNKLDDELEVNGFSEYRPAFMNRQMITLLLARDSSTQAMELLRNKMVDNLLALFDDAVSKTKYQKLLGFTIGFGGTVLREVAHRFKNDSFVHDLLSVQCTKSVQQLIKKTRIHVPNGAHLYGVIDERGLLKENQIFIRLRDDSLQKHVQTIRGPAFVTRSPSLHPGDIRMVECVDIPDLYYLENVIVFPRVGSRPLTDMISGGDLDGDRYTAIWDKTLFPKSDFMPMDFTKPEVVEEPPVYPDSYINFFVKFMATDALGRIANAWQSWAEREEQGAASEKCLTLARLFSLAVDYPKTGGDPIVMPRELVPDEYPEYMMNPFKPPFSSKSFIGASHYYFKEMLGSFMRDFEQDKLITVDDDLIDYPGSDAFLNAAQQSFEEYEQRMNELIRVFEVTEVEAFSGIILFSSKYSKRRQNSSELKIRFSSIRSDLLRQFERGSIDELAKASAWYKTAYVTNQRMLGFAWLVFDKLLKIKVQAK